MKITEVKIFKTDSEDSHLRAYASVKLDDCFVIRDLRVIQGKERLFIAMPSKRRKDGKDVDVVHPINSETRKMFEDAILEEYNKETEE